MQINLRFQHYMDAAVIAENANKGTLQVLNERRDSLIIVAQRGFTPEFLKHFEIVKAFDSSACGRALGTRNTVIINNIEKDIGFKPYVDVARSAGYMAVKSIPILNSAQQCVGVISLHYMEANSVKETNSLDLILPALLKLIESEEIVPVKA